MKRMHYFLRTVLGVACLMMAVFFNASEARLVLKPGYPTASASVQHVTFPLQQPGANQAKPDGVVRILAIGNSFSVDALESHLYDLAKASGKKIIVGNLAIAGGSLAQHVTNLQNNLVPYNFTKIDSAGNKTTTFNNAIEPILTSEPWDYISLQQVSQNSGMYETFIEPLPVLFKYLKEKATNPRVKLILHQTWAYAQNSGHTGFANYQNNQQIMFAAISDTYKKAGKLVKAYFIVPAGTAIQNARTSVLGDQFTRDGFHLEETYARYTAACAWFEKIFATSVLGNSYKPASISDYYKEMAQQAAHLAVKRPGKITVLKNYQKEGR